MPVYEYRCSACGALSSRTCAISDMPRTIACDVCGEEAGRVISRPAVHLSKASKLERLDPKYDRMVDRAMSNTQNAEPDRILKKMKPFPADKS